MNLNDEMWTGSQVHELRLRLGWCTANLARHLGCHQDQILKWESGQESPDPSYFSLFRYLFDSAEINAEKVQQRPLADNVLREHNLGQINEEEMDRFAGQP